MASDASFPRTRRALLAAALGAGAATVASALDRPLPARAADGGAVILGTTNYSNTETTIINSDGYSPAVGLVVGGVYLGIDTSAWDLGLKATANGDTGIGIFGNGRGATTPGTGVLGVSGHGDPGWSNKTGVYGFADSDTASRGVIGRSPAGVGVLGDSATGTAGMFGTPKPAGGVHAGIALRAVGRVKFDRCAGVATIASGAKGIRVTPGVDLVSGSAVVATLQGSAGGAVVERVAVSTTANTFTIYLTKASTRKVKVAWHLFG